MLYEAMTHFQWLVFKDCLMTISIKFIHRNDGILTKRIGSRVTLPGSKSWFHYLLAIYDLGHITSILSSLLPHL